MADDRCGLLCLDLPKAEALRSSRLPSEIADARARVMYSLTERGRQLLDVALREVRV